MCSRLLFEVEYESICQMQLNVKMRVKSTVSLYACFNVNRIFNVKFKVNLNVM